MANGVHYRRFATRKNWRNGESWKSKKEASKRNVAKRPVHVMLGFFEEQADTLAEIANYVRHLRIMPRSFEELANCPKTQKTCAGELAGIKQLCRASLENDSKTENALARKLGANRQTNSQQNPD